MVPDRDKIAPFDSAGFLELEVNPSCHGSGCGSNIRGRGYGLVPFTLEKKMKLTLDRNELLELLIRALSEEGFQNIKEVRIDLGDASLGLDDIHGLIVDISK